MDYRAYVLDDDGHITGVHELDCTSDDDAKQQAAKLLDGQNLEVWHGAPDFDRHLVKHDLGIHRRAPAALAAG